MFKMCSLFSPHQNTPLHFAAHGGHTETVQYLIANRAEVNITNDGGVSECDCNC